MIYYPTVMARYSLFVLKVPVNPKQTNKTNNADITVGTMKMNGDAGVVDNLLVATE